MNTYKKLTLAFLLLILVVPQVGAGPYTKRLRKVFGSEEQKPQSPENSLIHPDAEVDRVIMDSSNHYHRPGSPGYGGKYVKYYENRQKKFEADYKDGKLLSASSWKPDGEPCPVTKIIDGSGIFVTWHENGQKEKETHYKNGKEDGRDTSWHENGQKEKETPYKDGKEDGLVTEWYENGQKKLERNYKDGELDGPFTTWHENGQKKYEGRYKDGKTEGLASLWDDNGKKRQEWHYKNGEEYGFTQWYENGEKAERRYKNGKRGKSVTVWWPNDQKKSEKLWNEDGKRHGFQRYWYENGRKSAEKKCDNDILVSASSWKPDGEPCPVTKIIDGSGIFVTWHENGQKKSEVYYKNGLEVDGFSIESLHPYGTIALVLGVLLLVLVIRKKSDASL